MDFEYTRIDGPDARAFCQAQLTIDTERMEPSLFYPAGWCAPDGRVLVTMLIALRGTESMLVMPRAMMPVALQRIEMFRIGRKLQVDAPFSALPVDTPAHVQTPECIALAYDRSRSLQLTGDEKRSEGPGDRAAHHQWLAADIQHCMPWIQPETSGRFLPQMLGLESLGGLSYTKGCYPGQEVVARVHYRGRVKRRISRFRLSPAIDVEPGMPLDVDGASATILYALAAGDGNRSAGSTHGLAVVPADCEPRAGISTPESSGLLLANADTMLGTSE